MKRIALTLSLLITILTLTAQPSERQREDWRKEMQTFKNEFIAKQLGLTDEQKAKFTPVYNEMDAEIWQVQRDTHRLERKTCDKSANISDLEYEKAAEAVYELKGRENAIEMKYFAKFKEILTPKQLFNLKEAERAFSRELIKHQREHRQQHPPRQGKPQKAKPQ